MSKVITVEGKIYDELDRLRGRRQTFSQVIESLLIIKERLVTMYQGLELRGRYLDQEHDDDATDHDDIPDDKS